MRSFANNSYLTEANGDVLFEPNANFFKEMSLKLEKAARTIPFAEFSQLSTLVIKKCLKKSEVDPSFS